MTNTQTALSDKYGWTPQELATIERLVTDRDGWAILKKFFSRKVALWWDILHKTLPDDEKLVLSNHKLAVAAHASLEEIVQEMMAIAADMSAPDRPAYEPDVTTELFGQEKQ